MNPVPGLEETLARLVAIDSTSTRSNAAIIDFLERRLVAAGFAAERLPYRDDAGVEKVNLVARKGGDGLAALALVGHSDCVPYDAAWTEALTLVERDGRLYGRGAADTKSFIACALLAVERAAHALAQPLVVVFTADEELGCVGAKRLVELGRPRARHAIIGEPTSLVPVRANKGYCLAEVEVLGVEGHSAYPDTGASAIFRAARLLQRLEQLAAHELRQAKDLQFEPPFTTLNVGLVSGGKAKNIIPGACRFTLEWRPIPAQRVELVPELIEQVRGELTREDPGFSFTFTPLRMDSGVATDPAAEVVRFVSEQTGHAPTTVAFGTEAPMLTALGAQAVVFGPGDIKVAHRTGEFVPKDELHRAEVVLENAIRRFCSPG